MLCFSNMFQTLAAWTGAAKRPEPYCHHVMITFGDLRHAVNAKVVNQSLERPFYPSLLTPKLAKASWNIGLAYFETKPAHYVAQTVERGPDSFFPNIFGWTKSLFSGICILMDSGPWNPQTSQRAQNDCRPCDQVVQKMITWCNRGGWVALDTKLTN